MRKRLFDVGMNVKLSENVLELGGDNYVKRAYKRDPNKSYRVAYIGQRRFDGPYYDIRTIDKNGKVTGNFYTVKEGWLVPPRFPDLQEFL